MRVKSFFGSSVPSAIRMARQELGAEAIILSTRRAAADSEHAGEFEVVIGIAAEPVVERPAPPVPIAEPQRTGVMEPALETAVQAGLARLRERIGRSRSRATGQIGAFDLASTLLTEAGFDRDVTEEVSIAAANRARKYAGEWQKRNDTSPQSLLERATAAGLAEELKNRLRAAPELGCARGRRIVAFAGPPGSGKTSTLVKLAVSHGLARRVKVRIISTDTHRVAASALLRRYAEAMKVPIEFAEGAEQLQQALLSSDDGSSLTLIDTPGFSMCEMATAAPLAGFLSRRTDIDVHLVLPATMHPATLALLARAYNIFLPAKLLFAHVDQAHSTAPMIAEALRTERPISFLGSGPAIPEDIREASASALVDSMLGGKGAAAAVSAA